MYSQNDLDEAVAAGALSVDQANALRAFVEQQRATPAVDEGFEAWSVDLTATRMDQRPTGVAGRSGGSGGSPA